MQEFYKTLYQEVSYKSHFHLLHVDWGYPVKLQYQEYMEQRTPDNNSTH